MFGRAQAIAEEGIRSGELCDVDWMQMIYSALGANVFYFLSAPMMRLIAQNDPLEPSAMAARRMAAIEFLGQSIFTDRKHGAHLARRVLAAVPVPDASPERKPA